MANLSLRGVMLAPDEYDRVRVLLVDEDGGAPPSWRLLLDHAPGWPGTVPYRLERDAAAGSRGVFWAAVPKRHRAHWLAVAAGLRGRLVRAEVTPRRWRVDDRAGLSFDLAWLEEAPQ